MVVGRLRADASMLDFLVLVNVMDRILANAEKPEQDCSVSVVDSGRYLHVSVSRHHDLYPNVECSGS